MLTCIVLTGQLIKQTFIYSTRHIFIQHENDTAPHISFTAPSLPDNPQGAGHRGPRGHRPTARTGPNPWPPPRPVHRSSAVQSKKKNHRPPAAEPHTPCSAAGRSRRRPAPASLALSLSIFFQLLPHRDRAGLAAAVGPFPADTLHSTTMCRQM